jgi:IS5 family transposase
MIPPESIHRPLISESFSMPESSPSPDLFRQPLAQMIDLRHPLAVLADRLPWAQIEAALAPRFARQARAGRAVPQDDLFGTSMQIAGAGVSAAGRPRLPIRLMASLLYLKHAYKLSDEELVQRWAENVVWVRRRNWQGVGGASPLQ